MSEEDEKIKRLIIMKKIGMLSIDTNIMYERGFKLLDKHIESIIKAKKIGIKFCIPEIIIKEIERKISKDIYDSYNNAKKYIGKLLYYFEKDKPTRDEILKLISSRKDLDGIARDNIKSFINKTGCKVIRDVDIIDIESIIELYFSHKPPFSKNKKCEFPDAIALDALERTAKKEKTFILVVSRDKDWREFCKSSEYLYLMEDINSALSVIINAPEEIKHAIEKWIDKNYNKLMILINREIENIDFYVDGIASIGRMEAQVYEFKLNDIEFSEKNDIDIINTEWIDDNTIMLQIAIPSTLHINLIVDVEFYIYDSIDKDEFSFGGRTIEFNEEINTTIYIDFLYDTKNKSIASLERLDIEEKFYYINLGEIDVMDLDDCE